jgi:hypothetical protein
MKLYPLSENFKQFTNNDTQHFTMTSLAKSLAECHPRRNRGERHEKKKFVSIFKNGNT